jgi:hypothetical protein
MYDDDLLPTGIAVGVGGMGAGPTALAFTGSNTMMFVTLAISAILVGLFLLRTVARRQQST